MILSPQTAIDECLGTLQGGPEAFYDLRHQILYRELIEMRNQDRAIDLATTWQWILDRNLQSKLGSPVFIASLPEAVHSVEHLPAWIEILNGKKLLRDIIVVSAKASLSARESQDDPNVVMDEFERAVLAIRPKVKKRRTLRQIVQSAIESIERVFHKTGSVEGIETGFADLDLMTGGLHPGEMTVLAGFPGSGKTSLGMNIVEHSLLKLGLTAAVFSLEMSAETLASRFICSHARVNLRNISRGYVQDSDFRRLATAAGKLSGSKICFEDDSDISIFQLRSRARRLHQQHGLSILVVDYLQLLSAVGGARRIESRQQEVSDISRGIKGVARELNIPVIALSQLNDDGKLRESRAIGQDADNVWVLKMRESNEGAIGVDLLIEKQRNGPRGTVKLTFIPSLTRFESAAKIQDEDLPGLTTRNPNADP